MSLKNSLFNPAHVAIIGASDDPGKTTGRPVAFLQQHGFAGKITPVNPNRPSVGGLPAVKSLRDAEGKVDHAFILTQGDMVEQAVEDCIAMQVGTATLLASGFAEAGNEGLQRQQRLVAKARQHGLRLLGPNSIGQVNTANGFTCTANAAFRIDRLIKGRVGLLSQSGSMIGGILSRAQARGIGFSKLVSVGNEADLTVGEIGEALADDPETDAFVLFLESIRAPEHMEAFAAACAKLGKPIVAFKLGRSKLGQEMSVSHTGAMIGSDRLDACFLADLGIHRLGHFEALFEAPSLLTKQKTAQADKPVAVVTTTGGGAALVVDQLGVLGILMVQSVDTAVHPPSSLAAFYALNYRDGLYRLARFKRLCTPEQLQIVESGGDCIVSVEWPYAIEAEPAITVDITFATLVELGRRATGYAIVPRRLELTRPRPIGTIHTEYFGCPIRTEAPRNLLVLDAADLDRPFPGHNPEMLEMLTPALGAALGELEAQSSVAEQVKIVVKRNLASGQPCLSDVAKQLGMSDRTLQRRITQEGSTFRDLLSDARRDLSHHLLTDPATDIDEVACLLGYQDTTSFYRAFREWEGMPPNRWREMNIHRIGTVETSGLH